MLHCYLCHTLAHLQVPKGWFGRRVTQSHLRHHFNDHAATFHVSFGMGWIDRLMGTPYEKSAAQERFDPETILSMEAVRESAAVKIVGGGDDA